jgi:hypothetical protein
MTQILQTIEEIIKRNFLVVANGGTYLLEEENEPNLPKTTIKQKGKMLLYNFDTKDSNTSVFPIFNEQYPNLTKIADYFIFYPKEDTLFVFICNLKSTNNTGAGKQAEAGWLLSKYLIKTTERILNFQPIKVEYRSICFWKGKGNRFETNMQKPKFDSLGNSGLKNINLEIGADCFLDRLCH